MRKEKKIVITGGHAAPGLALLEELKKSGWQVAWFGETKAMEGAGTLEAQTIPRLGVAFYKIESAKIHRKFPFRSFLSFWKILAGFFESLVLLSKIKPSVVLSFGSYVSIPVAFAAWVLRIPVIIHEQTASSGLANRLVAKIAEKIAISFETSKEYFPERKTVLTGNLVRSAFFKIGKKKKSRKNALPVIYITGGSRGSRIINSAVLEVLPELLSRAKIYHQTGQLDFEKIQEVKRSLPENLRERYEISALCSPSEVEKIYEKADVVVARAGANTVSELAVTGTPAILVPIPWSESNEQEKNAVLLAETGLAAILNQEKLSGRVLLEEIEKMLMNIKGIKKSADKAKKLVPENAPARLVALIDHAAIS